LGIAQSLINDPKILILDEPTAGIDPKERAKFRNIISGLSLGRIIVLSTHIASDVEYIADKIMFMKDGQLVLQGSNSNICDAIQGFVWFCQINPEDVAKVTAKYVVSNLHHVDDAVEMRIVSEKKPYNDAVLVTPKLEDLYLYYFKEDQQK